MLFIKLLPQKFYVHSTESPAILDTVFYTDVLNSRGKPEQFSIDYLKCLVCYMQKVITYRFMCSSWRCSVVTAEYLPHLSCSLHLASLDCCCSFVSLLNSILFPLLSESSDFYQTPSIFTWQSKNQSLVWHG